MIWKVIEKIILVWKNNLELLILIFFLLW